MLFRTPVHLQPPLRADRRTRHGLVVIAATVSVSALLGACGPDEPDARPPRALSPLPAGAQIPPQPPPTEAAPPTPNPDPTTPTPTATTTTTEPPMTTTPTTTTPTTPTSTPTSVPAATHRMVQAAGTTFSVHVRGGGPAMVLIHGAGEGAEMLSPLADVLAAAGRTVVTYDRRGTGASGRDDWPGNGAPQHADDAAALIRALELDHPQVVGFSSGGVIALDLAVRHPQLVGRTFLWEAPALGVVPDAAAMNDAIMAPIRSHLAEHPGDFVGAQAILLTAILGFPVAVDDPAFAAAREHAEPMIRDEPSIPLRTFTAEELAGLDVTVAVGIAPNEIVAAASDVLTGMIGTVAAIVPTDDHDAHLDGSVALAEAILQRR